MDLKDPCLFTEDAIKNLSLVLSIHPNLKTVFTIISSVNGIVHGGFVRELCRCTSALDFLRYLETADIDIIVPKEDPSNRAVFYNRLSKHFGIETHDASYCEPGVPKLRVNEEEHPREYKYLLREALEKRIKKKKRTQEQYDFLIDQEVKKISHSNKLKVTLASWSVFIDVCEANDVPTFLQHNTDFNINGLMIRTKDIKLSVKPGLKLYLNQVIHSIRNQKFKAINKEFCGVKKNFTLEALFRRFIHMLHRGYWCDLSDLATQKIATLSLRGYLICRQFKMENVQKEIDFITRILKLKFNFRIWKKHSISLLRLASTYSDCKFFEEVLSNNRKTSAELKHMPQMISKYFKLYNFEGDKKIIVLVQIIVEQLEQNRIDFIQQTQILIMLEEYLGSYSRHVVDINKIDYLFKTKQLSNAQMSVGPQITAITGIILRALGSYGDIEMFKRFVKVCRLNTKFIFLRLNHPDKNVWKQTIDANKLTMMDYLLSFKEKITAPARLITDCLLHRHVEMAYLLQRYDFRIEEKDFDSISTKKFIDMIQDIDVLRFCRNCPSFKLSSDYQERVFQECEYKHILYLHDNLNILFPLASLDNICIDYKKNRDKLHWWMIHNPPIEKIRCWEIGALVDTLVKLYPNDIAVFLKMFSFNFVLEFVFYNCATNNKYAALTLKGKCIGNMYIYDNNAKIGWRLVKEFEKTYGIAILELLFTKKLRRLGTDMKNCIMSFL